jgi:hypothetical protein
MSRRRISNWNKAKKIAESTEDMRKALARFGAAGDDELVCGAQVVTNAGQCGNRAQSMAYCNLGGDLTIYSPVCEAHLEYYDMVLLEKTRGDVKDFRTVDLAKPFNMPRRRSGAGSVSKDCREALAASYSLRVMLWGLMGLPHTSCYARGAGSHGLDLCSEGVSRGQAPLLVQIKPELAVSFYLCGVHRRMAEVYLLSSGKRNPSSK